jgi:phosphopantetheinyl transferase
MNKLNRWIVGTLDVRSSGGTPIVDDWLSETELAECARWRDARRRNDWLAGRRLLKSMIREELAIQCPGQAPATLPDIEVLSCDALGRSVRPRACVAGQWLPWHLSLAHAEGVVWAAMSTTLHIRVGIDVVPADASLDAACELWFTAGEQSWLHSAIDRRPAATLWAIKEAIYKGTNCGEPFIPTRIDVRPDAQRRYIWSCNGIPRTGDDELYLSRQGDCIVALVALGAGAEPGRTRCD